MGGAARHGRPTRWSIAGWRGGAGCGVLVVAGGASMLQHSVLLNHPAFRPGMDFVARYAAGAVSASGPGPYDTQRLCAVEQDLSPGLEPLPFFDPPPTAALFRVLAGLPMPVAAALWEVLTVLGIAAVAVLLARTFGARRSPALVVAVGLVALFAPVRASMALGQVDVLLVLPFVAAVALCLRGGAGGPVAAGAAALAVLTLDKPQLAVLPVIVLIVVLARSWPLSASAGAAASVAVLTALAAVLKIRRWRSFVRLGSAIMPLTWAVVLERATGIEPAQSVWKTETLPLSYARVVSRRGCTDER